MKKYVDVNRVLFASILFCMLFLHNVSANEQPSGFLNQKEKTWILQQKEPIKVGTTSIPNQVLLGHEGEYRGFAIDLFRLIEKEAGITFNYVYFKTWDELIDAAKQKKIDIVFLLQKTPSRLAYINFTDTVLSQQNKIIVNVDNDSGTTSVENLEGKKVAVTKGSAIHAYLQFTYPLIKLLPVKTELEALQVVAERSADAAISEAVRASYYIEKYDLDSLRIAGDLDYDYHLSIGNRNDLPVLSVILSKTVTHIPPQKIEALQLKWGYTQEKSYFLDQQVLIYLAIAFGIILPFSLFLLYLNQHLQREIVVRKRAVEELKAANDTIRKLKLLTRKDT